MSENITEEIIENDVKNNNREHFEERRSGNDVTEENCRFTEGQPLKFVRVRFPGHNKSYPFLIGKRKVFYGQKVVAMSDRGIAVGYINSFTYEIPFSKNMLPLKNIHKIATDEDIATQKENYRKEKSTETVCQNLITKYNLDMNLTHVEFTQFGKKVVFYFTAPARVDFRELVKDLVSELKLRIELRQISVRDRAASMGNLGPCGRELCCSSFLSKYGNANVRMAKNQNLTLNYSKLNGVCGQLKCCLQYEDEVYTHKRNKMPEENQIVKTKNGDIGVVRRLNILGEQFDMLTSKGIIRRYSADQFVGAADPAQMPRDFEHVRDETSSVVGLADYNAAKANQFAKDIEEAKQQGVVYAYQQMAEFKGEEFSQESVPQKNFKNANDQLSVGMQHLNNQIQDEPVQVAAPAMAKAETTPEENPNNQQPRPRNNRNNRFRNKNRNRNNPQK
jgi:cell fate regulator YaaT (PSP1 superfamily)